MKKLDNHHPNIKLGYKIGQSLPYLDVILTNSNGILSTSVYHKLVDEPYAVSFASDHLLHSNHLILNDGIYD